MKSLIMVAALLAGAAQPAAAEPFELECENEQIESFSAGGRRPIKRVTVSMVRISVDPAAKTALFRFTNPDGTSGTTVRNIMLASANDLVICQAEVCQQRTTNNEVTTYFGLTSIDLRTGKLSRSSEASTPDPQLGAVLKVGVSIEGMCRKL